MRSHHVTRAVLSAIVATAATGVSAQSFAQDSPQSSPDPQTSSQSQSSSQTESSSQGEATPETQKSQLVRTFATVQRIDKSRRMVGLKGADGQVFSVQAGPNVDLGALKVGDKVGITYYEEMAVSLNNSVASAPTMTQSRTQRGGVTSMQTTVTATVVSINLADNTVVLRGPQGLRTVHVQDPDLQARLRTIRPGQAVTMTYTEAMAISMQRYR